MHEQFEDFLSMMEANHIRHEAIDLYDHCLAEGNPVRLVKFIEKQLSYNPPQLELLSDIANDLQQRLFTLREYHFDVREKIVITIKEMYNIDVTPLMPANDVQNYHQIAPDKIIQFLVDHKASIDEQERLILFETLRASRDVAQQLRRDIELTEKLHDMILDWIYALTATYSRAGWQLIDWPQQPISDQDEMIH